MARVEKPVEEQKIPNGNPMAIIEFLLNWYYFELGKMQINMQSKFENSKAVFDVKDAQALEFIVSRIDWLEEQQIRFKKRTVEGFAGDQFKKKGKTERKDIASNEGETD